MYVWSLPSLFETPNIRSTITNEEYRTLVLPTITHTKYRDADLRNPSPFIAPCADDESGYTVHERQDTFEAQIQEVDHERTGQV